MRAIVPHVDDLGASHGANAAFFELAAAGLVTCGSVMVPGAWFPEVAAAAARDPALDLGVHLTLTSEWDTCRWAPLSTTSRASGLLDGDGYFWRDVDSLRRHMVVEAAEAELRTQVERAVAAGLRPTHLDAHMGAAMLPALLGVHIGLAREFGAIPILPRTIRWAPDPAAYAAALATLPGPVIDHCRGTLPVAADALEDAWRGVVEGLQPGVTHLALHCTAPGDFAAMSPLHDPWRTAEYAMLRRGHLRDLCAEHGVDVLGTRALQRRWITPGAAAPWFPAGTTGRSGRARRLDRG